MWELTTEQVCIIGLHILWISGSLCLAGLGRETCSVLLVFQVYISYVKTVIDCFHSLVKWWCCSIKNVYTRVIDCECRKPSQLHRISRPNGRFLPNPYRNYFYLQLHLPILHSSHFTALTFIYCQTARFRFELCVYNLVVKGGYVPFTLCVLALIQTISIQFKFICFATCPGPQKLWLSWTQKHTSIPPEY